MKPSDRSLILALSYYRIIFIIEYFIIIITIIIIISAKFCNNYSNVTAKSMLYKFDYFLIILII
jgi:hypothetical protein